MNRTLILASSLVASFLLASSIALVPYFSGNNAVNAQETEDQGQGQVKHVTLIASEKEVQVAPDNALHPGGIMYNAMVFNGTIPGPVISIDQGDTINITLKNEGQTIHSLDFHAGVGPSEVLSGSVKPGEEKTWSLTAEFPGVFMYHCGADGLNGVWEHIANGMYGAMVVHPTDEEPAKEFYVVFSELYNNADQGPFVGSNGTGSFDIGKFISNNPDLVLTNGMAHKYVPAVGEVNKLELNKDAEVFQVTPGELTRWYILNPGPNDGVSFHFISGLLSGVRDGSNEANNAFGTQALNEETWWIPPGSASVIESTFPEAGLYVGVDHAMSDVVKGGAIAVMASENSTATDHPEGTCVAAKGEGVVCAEVEDTETAEGAENQTEAEAGEDAADGTQIETEDGDGAGENQTETEDGDGAGEGANDENGN
jgi:nitrite reductase (NO-forming)